jgi:glycosyltransferase involved in cell wall biosynthesis
VGDAPAHSAALRVVSVAHSAILAGGARRRYLRLLDAGDVDLTLVVPRLWREFGREMRAEAASEPGLKLEILPILLPEAGSMGWYLHFYPGLRRSLRRLRPQVLHLWEEPWSVVALQAALLKGDAALVLEVDQNILKRLPPPFENIRRFVLKRCAHILARSADAAEVVRACGYAGPISYIGYGVDSTYFRPRVAPPPAHEGLAIGYVGRLIEEKGLDDAIEAIAGTLAPVRLEIMGEGPHEERLKQRIRELGVGARVAFRPWGTPHEVAAFLQGLDLSLLLTRTTPHVREQFGRVIIESQGCGVPVVGSTCGAIPDIVGDGGWIVPENAPEALAALLDRLAEDPAQLAQKSQAALRNVAERFNYEALATALRGVYLAAARSAEKSSRGACETAARSTVLR